MINLIKKIVVRDQISNLIQSFDCPKICEVGVRLGEYFDKLLCKNVKEAYGVDIWRSTDSLGQNDNLYNQNVLDDQYKTVFNKYLNDNRVRLIREFSVNAATFFPDEYFDFVYIDADHTYDAVKSDLQAWYTKVKIGGVLAGHDYIPEETSIRMGHSVPFGTVKAVNEFLISKDIDENYFHLTSEIYSTYFIIKK